MQEKFDALNRVIKERQAFENEHPFPPYSVYKTTINFTDVEGKSLLHYAVEMNDVEKIKVLLAQGANINQKNIYTGETLLDLAVKNNSLQALQILYENGLDCRYQALPVNNHSEAYAWFRQQGLFSIHASYPLNSSDLVLAASNQFFDSSTNHLTLLLRSAELGNLAYFYWLDDIIKRQGIPSDLIDPKTPFSNIVFAAIKMASANNHIDVIEYILQSSLVDKIKIDLSKRVPETAFREALKYDRREIIQFFLAKCQGKNSVYNYEYSLLMLAIEEGNEFAVQEIIKFNPDLKHKNYSLNNVLHCAVKSNVNILKILLEQENIITLLEEKNCYGLTPLDIAFIENKKDCLSLLNELFPNFKPTIDWTTSIPIPQNQLMPSIHYYQITNYYCDEFFKQEGLCSGLGYLMHRYDSMTKRKYVLSNYEYMIKPSGSTDKLNQAIPDTSPQREYYKIRAELFEQWSNNLIWFQQYGNLAKATGFSQYARVRQQQIIDPDPDYIPIQVYDTNEMNPSSYDNAQLNEILEIFFQMPRHMRLEMQTLLNDGNKDAHNTALMFNNNNNDLYFYDSNVGYPVNNISTVDNLIRSLIDSQFRMLKYHRQNDLQIRFKFFFFSKDQHKFSADYQFLKQFPSSKEDALKFQERSPNRFSYLHVAVISRCQKDLEQLLRDNYCDIFAEDRFKKTSLDLAIENNNIEAALLLLKCADKMHLLDKISSREKGGLLNIAISNNSYGIVKYLLEISDLDINDGYSFQYLSEYPLRLAIKKNCDTSIIIELLSRKAELFKLDLVDEFVKAKHAFALVMDNIWYYPDIIDFLGDINSSDSNGNTALHFAIKTSHLKVIEDLVRRGGNLLYRNGKEVSPLDLLIENCGEMDEKTVIEILKIIFNSDAYKKNSNLYKPFIFKMLNKSIINGQLQLFNFLIKHSDSAMLRTYNEHGITLLHYAVNLRKYDFAKILLLMGADVNCTMNNWIQNTCLHTLVANEGSLPLIELLIQYGAESNIPNGENKTVRDLLKSTSNHKFSSQVISMLDKQVCISVTNTM